MCYELLPFSSSRLNYLQYHNVLKWDWGWILSLLHNIFWYNDCKLPTFYTINQRCAKTRKQDIPKNMGPCLRLHIMFFIVDLQSIESNSQPQYHNKLTVSTTPFPFMWCFCLCGFSLCLYFWCFWCLKFVFLLLDWDCKTLLVYFSIYCIFAIAIAFFPSWYLYSLYIGIILLDTLFGIQIHHVDF